MADFYASQEVKSEEEYELWLDFALDNGADCIGPATILKASGDQSYFALAQPRMLKMARRKGMLVHAYPVVEMDDFKTYDSRGVRFLYQPPRSAA
jgi:glycerophosphoryl diester phosphodiesterase